jgi:hypothetical protein
MEGDGALKDGHRLKLSDTVSYRIRVQGSLDDSWYDYLGSQMKSSQQRDGGLAVTTLVTAPVDQAALMGLISRLYALRLPLLLVEVSGQIAGDQPILEG